MVYLNDKSRRQKREWLEQLQMLEDGDALKLFHKIGYDVKLGKNRVANKGKVRLIS